MHVMTKVSSSISRTQGLPPPKKTKLLRGFEPQNSSPPTKSKSKSSHRQDWFHKKITCPDSAKIESKIYISSCWNFYYLQQSHGSLCCHKWPVLRLFIQQQQPKGCNQNYLQQKPCVFFNHQVHFWTHETLEEDTWDFTVKWRRSPVQPPTQNQIPSTQKHLNFPYSKAGRIMMSTTTIAAAAAAVAAYILTHSCSTIHQILSN